MSIHVTKVDDLANDPCVGKLTFENKEQAIGARTIAKLEHGNDDLEPYLCEKCNLWHLATKQPEDD